MQRLFLALLVALSVWNCEGGKECRPRVSAFLNCMRRGENPAATETRGFESPNYEKADAMVKACYERLDCIKKPSRTSPARPRFPLPLDPSLRRRNSVARKVQAAALKCQATMTGSLASEMETCMRSSEQGWTDFTISSGMKDPRSPFGIGYWSWLPQFRPRGSQPVFYFHQYQRQLDQAFASDSSCSDSQRQSLVSCLEGVSQKLYPTCESPLQSQIRMTQDKAGFCNRIESCAEESLSPECESELSEVPASLCHCALRVADAGERRGNGTAAELQTCVEAELVKAEPQFVVEHGRATIRSTLKRFAAAATTRFCPVGLSYFRKSRGRGAVRGPRGRVNVRGGSGGGRRGRIQLPTQGSRIFGGANPDYMRQLRGPCGGVPSPFIELPPTAAGRSGLLRG